MTCGIDILTQEPDNPLEWKANTLYSAGTAGLGSGIGLGEGIELSSGMGRDPNGATGEGNNGASQIFANGESPFVMEAIRTGLSSTDPDFSLIDSIWDGQSELNSSNSLWDIKNSDLEEFTIANIDDSTNEITTDSRHGLGVGQIIKINDSVGCVENDLGTDGITLLNLTFDCENIDLATNTFLIDAHGIKDGWLVQFDNKGGSLPSGLSDRSYYPIKYIDNDSFQVTADGTNIVQITAFGSGTCVLKTVDPDNGSGAGGFLGVGNGTNGSSGKSGGSGGIPVTQCVASTGTYPGGINAGALLFIKDIKDAFTFTMSNNPDSINGLATDFLDAGSGVLSVIKSKHTTDNVVWTAREKFLASVDSPLFWETLPKYELNEDFKAFLDTFVNTTSMLLPIFDIVLTAAEIIKFLITGGVNPALKAVSFVLDQLITYVKDLRAGGLHYIQVLPVEGVGKFKKINDITASNDATVKKTGDAGVRYLRDLFGLHVTADGKDPFGIYTLSKRDCFNKFYQSLDDAADQSRPPVSDSAYVGAVVIYFGISGNFTDIASKIISIYKLYYAVFGLHSYKELIDGLQKLLDVTIDRKNITDKNNIQKTLPDWSTFKTTSLIPGSDSVLSSILGWASGLKDSIDKAGKEMDNIVKSIEKKIKYIKQLISEVEGVLESINAIQNVDTSIIRAMYVPPQSGGLKKLVTAMKNSSIKNAPTDDDYCGMVCFAGSGPGFSLLANMLTKGAVPFTVIDEDSSISSREKWQQKFDFLDNDDLEKYKAKLNKRVEDRQDWLAENTTFSDE